MILLDNLFGRFPDIRGQIVTWKRGSGVHCYRSTDLQRLSSNYSEISEDIYFHITTHDPEKFDIGGRGKNRTAQQFTCFWADIDLATKDSIKYPTREEVSQLFGRLEAKGVKPSCVINSSTGGIHVYWFLDKPYECDEYRGVVKSWIRMLSTEINDIVERKITIDAVGEMARVLRLPGTMNKKAGEIVSLNFESNLYYPIEQLIEATSYTTEGPSNNRGKGSNTLLDKMGMTSPVKLGEIDKVLPQCAQLEEYLRTGGQMIEPVWYQMAGLFSYFLNGESMFIKVSELADPFMDSDRSEAGALKKMAQWKSETTGPPTCKAMDYNNPDVCDKCVHWEKITTPIQLSVSDPIPIEPEVVVIENEDELLLVKKLIGKDKDYEFIPPAPYSFNNDGSLVVAKGSKSTLVCTNRVIPLKRVSSDGGRVNVTMFQVLQKGETLETVKSEPVPILQGDINGGKALSDLDSANALTITYSVNEMKNYLTQTIRAMNLYKDPMIVHESIGWHDDYFLLGKMRVMKGMTFQEDELSSSLQKIVGDIQYKGKIDEWRKATSVLNRLGMEPHRLAFFGGFAAPLFMATDHSGIMVNLLSRDSGTFKSFTLKMITSIYGEPAFNIITNRDTENALMTKMATRRDLPISYDEITNIKPEDLSDLVYAITQGKDKDRLDNAANMKKTADPWRTIVVTSSNASLDDKLGAVNTAERMRLLELSVQGVTKYDPISAAEASSVMHTLSDNYGGVGLMWIAHLVDNRERIFDEVRKMITALSEETGSANDKRFWITYVAVCLIAAKETYELGFHTCDLKMLKDYCMTVLSSHHEKILGDKTHVFEKIDEFMSSNLEGTMMTTRRGKGLGALEVTKEARREIVIYVENITGTAGESKQYVYLNRSKLRKFLSEKREDINELTKQLLDLGVLTKDKKGKAQTNVVKRVPLSNAGKGEVGMRSIGIDLSKYNEILSELKP